MDTAFLAAVGVIYCCTQGVLNKLYFNVYLVQWINTVINPVELQTEINNI